MTDVADAGQNKCSLLLFVATSTEEDALRQAAQGRGIRFEKIKAGRLEAFGWAEYHWLGVIGDETVIAVRPTRREGGEVVMGAVGRLGVAAKAIRFQEATGANGIVQLGMAFGIDPDRQKLGDVLVSSSLIPYDNRDVKADPKGQERYVVEYPSANREPARQALVDLFRREQDRRGNPEEIRVGSLLSGAARVHCKAFRDELVRLVPGGEDEIVGGEMEGVGLLAASVAADDPIWCIVKGISDFGDENRNRDIKGGRDMACRNAADFVLSALINDARP